MYCDVLLVNPPIKEYSGYNEHLGISYIAACLRKKGIDTEIIDAPINRWDVAQTINEIKKVNCKVVGISLPYQNTAKEAFQVIKAVKNECINAHFTIGGIYPSFAYQEILELFPEIQSVVLGEGEITTVELTECIINGGNWQNIKGIAYRSGNEIVKNEIRPLIKDLDSLPFPARDTLTKVMGKNGLTAILTSRGCYGRCSFCSVVPFFSEFGPKFRLRSASNVLDEVEYLYAKYNARKFSFNDANFIGGKGKYSERAREIAEEIIKRELHIEFNIQCRVDDVDFELFSILKKAGLNSVFLGVESGSPTMLERFRKDATVEQNYKAIEILSKLDIYIVMGFIMFDDKTNLMEFNENIAFINNAKRIVPKGRMRKVYILSKVLPFAGTEIEKEMKKAKKYKGNTIEFDYDIEDRRINTLYKCVKGIEGIINKFTKIWT